MHVITGGLGFVGSWLARMLLEEGEDIVTFSRSAPGKKESMFNSLNGKWVHVRGSLDSISDVLSLIKLYKPITIFHIGGMLSIPSENNPQASFRTNVEGMFHVLEAARLFDVKKVIYASTNGTYGQGLEKVRTIDDTTLQRPFTIYGCTKLFAELLGKYYRRKYGIDFRSIRLPAVVGPGSKTRHVSVYSAWAIEKSYFQEPFEIFVSPDTVCPIIYFKDAAKTFRDLAAVPESRIKTVNYNIAGIKPIPSAKELKSVIEQTISGSHLSFNPDPLAMEYQRMHQNVTWDDSAAVDEWNWKIGYNLNEMVEDFVTELQVHSEWYK